MAELFHLDFQSGAERYTTELVGFTDVDGNYWQSKAGGGSDILSASGFSQPSGGIIANQTTYKISTSSDEAATILDGTDSSEYRGRALSHLIQLFDSNSNPIGRPVSFPPSFMDVANTSWAPTGEIAIEMNCEGFFSSRNAPQYGYISDQHQKALYPTDRGLERQHLASADTFYTWPA